MGWKQWALLRFSNKTFDATLKLKFPDTGSHWGWPFADTQDTSTRNRIKYEDIEAKDIGPQTSYAYGQTGKQNEWAGMEGTVEIWTKKETGGLDQKVAKVFYSCPWGSANKFTITDVAQGWGVTNWGADFNGDALGSITMEIRKH
ncbi:hypothetical protein HD806DRAFT_525465 [Xylariaceae sp. AK1471]|nr:hypothetical protein HD806DRAFT_525465 [Xylariaceae sp. AK1471]